MSLEFARAEKAGDPFAFRFSAQPYLLRWEGGRFETATFDWNKEILADLQAVRMREPDPAITQRLGELLRAFLGATDWSLQEAQLLVALQEKRTVVLTIRSAAAELYALPWELLTIRSTGQHLGEIPGVLLRYEWPATSTAALDELARRESGRILFAWSAAGGAVPAAQQLAAIQAASHRGHQPFDPLRDVLQHVTCESLTARLDAAQRSQEPVAVLHLLCHGIAIGQSFGLALNSETPGGKPALVDAARLRQLLAPYAGMLRLVVLAACDSGNSGPLGSQLGSVAQTLHRAGIAQVIASRHPLSVPGATSFTDSFYSALLGGPVGTEEAFLSARNQLGRDPTQRDWASLQLYARAADGADSRPINLRPYRGLLAFQPEHRRFFFGREREVTEILTEARALLEKQQPRLLAVDGASGSGKSSVVFAGALPGLLELLGSGATFIRMRPGSDPLFALDAALAGRAPAAPLLLIVDQLEELFTQTRDAEQRREFGRRLFSLATSADPLVFVLLTLRSDFVGRCGELVLNADGLRLDRVIYDESHRVSIAQMDVQQQRSVIEQPARRVGLQLEPGLVERMLHAVDSEPGALPLLADTLDLLWLRREGRTLTQAAYDQLGGVTGALHGRADRLIAELSEPERRQARRLLVRLGSGLSDLTQGVRLRVRVSSRRPQDPQEAACFDSMLARLAAARLLVLDREGTEDTVEVAHEALLRRWPLLALWAKEDAQLNADLDLIEGWVRQWKRHDALLRGTQLERAAQLLARHKESLSPDAVELFERSRAEHDLAEERDRFARDCLRMLAVRALDGDVTRQAAILREAESRDPTAVPMWLPYAVDILQTGLLMHTELTGHPGAVIHSAMSPDGKRVATTAADGTVRVFGLAGGPPLVLSGHSGTVSWADFSPDSKRLVTAAADGTARIFSLDDERAPEILRGHTGDVLVEAGHERAVGISRDWKHFVTEREDKVRLIWSLDLSPELLLDRLRRATPFCLSIEDRERYLRETPDLARKNHALRQSR